MFCVYFKNLIEKMKLKYPSKKLVFVLVIFLWFLPLIYKDNLWAHKSSLIMKIMFNEDRCNMLLTPSNSPELSPIENMFSLTKKLLSKQSIKATPSLYALEVARLMFNFDK